MAFSFGKGLDKKKQQAIALSAIFGLLFLYVYFQFFLKSSLGKLMELNGSISQQRAKVVMAEALVGRKPEMKKTFSVLEEKMAKYKSSLCHHADIPVILQDISRIASESRTKILKMESIKEATAAQAPPMPTMPGMAAGGQPAKVRAVYSKVPIKVEATGGYHELGMFINNIENAKNFMEVKELEITGNSDDIHRHKISMIIVTYVLSEEQN